MEQIQKTFMDVQVIHPTAPSHFNKPLETIYKESENGKKRKYNNQVINIEKATFTPLVFLTTGGMGPECTKLNKRIAELISAKSGEKYSHIVKHLRMRLRFSLLRATLVAIRGVRGRRSQEEDSLEQISFNLIPRSPDL